MPNVDKTFQPIHEVDLCSRPSEDPGQSLMHADHQIINLHGCCKYHLNKKKSVFFCNSPNFFYISIFKHTNWQKYL